MLICLIARVTIPGLGILMPGAVLEAERSLAVDLVAGGFAVMVIDSPAARPAEFAIREAPETR